MSGVLSLHATFETAEYECLVMKFHADLRLCLFVNTLELISKEDANELKEKLANQVMDGKDYSDVLKHISNMRRINDFVVEYDYFKQN